MSDLKTFSFKHGDRYYNAKYQIDEVNQKVLIMGIFLQADSRDISAIVASSVMDSLISNIESTHLTHTA